MPIQINNFGGIVPMLTPEALRDNAAQTAENCDLTSGALRPIDVKLPFIDLKAKNGTLSAGIPSNEVFQIPKPAAPSVKQRVKLCQPESWLEIYAYTFVSWVNESGNNLVDCLHHGKATIKNIEYTEVGMKITCDFGWVQVAMQPDTIYHISGPKYRFVLNKDLEKGGPDKKYELPRMVYNSSPTFPSGIAPLTVDGSPGTVYARFQVDDVDGESFDCKRHFESEDYSSQTQRYNLKDVTFDINLNYANPRRRFYYYVQTMVKDRENEIEGVPSEISEKVVVLPGERIELDIPRAAGFSKSNLYRSGTGRDDFFLLKEADADSHIDKEDRPLGAELPAFGNHPDCNINEFLESSLIHPAQFGAAFLGNDLYCSDYYKFHVWPKENTIPFKESIKAIAMSGSTIVVFTTDSVFGVSGGNPAAMSKYLISNTAPLLNKSSLCRIGNAIFYSSHDGLIMISGGSAVNVTKNHFTRNEWLKLQPETMRLKTNDNSIFIEASGQCLKFDMDETLKAISSYTATNGIGFKWKSKRFHFPNKEVFDYARIEADGDVRLNIYTEKELAKSILVNDSQPVIMDGLNHACNWEFEVEAECEIRSMEFFERKVLPMGAAITLTAKNTPLWESIWLKFPDRGAFAGGILSAQSDKVVPLTFYRDGSKDIHTEYVFSGRVFRLPDSLQDATLWRIQLDSTKTIESLTLFARRKQFFNMNIREFRTDEGEPPWMLKTYESVKPVTFNACRVVANGYPVKIIFYSNNRKVGEREVTSDKAFRLQRMRPERKWSFDIIEQNGDVTEFSIASSMARLNS